MITNKLEKFSVLAMGWIGSVKSLVIHSILFVSSFLLYFLKVENVLLIVTTIVSIEAIYLSIFIQMSVNLQTKRLQNVEQDVVDIQENVEEIQEDVEEIQENVEDIQKEDEENDSDKILSGIEKTLNLLMKEFIELKKQQKIPNIK